MNNIIIFRLIITYLFCATILLLNLLFNPNIQWKYINIQTQEIQDVPCSLTILFCLIWILTIPKMLFGKNK